MSNNIPKNPSFCSFVPFLIVLLTTFIIKPVFSGDLTTFITSFISSVEIIIVLTADPDIFSSIAASVADATAVNPNGIKTIFAIGLSTFPIQSNPVFTNGLKNLPKNPPYCPIFDNFILADELFAKTLQSFET